MKSSFTRFAGAVGLLLLAGYAFIALQGHQGIPGLMEKRRLIREYEKKNADIARQIEEQRARIDRFRDSPTGPDLEIRKRLQLLKPGEKVFILQDGIPAPVAPHQ
ncbi:MAG TPA: septum formation initiator family protein [Bryobacteraceae bacterium]|nr:septum formation initiator family protein [Bryobacteraceae bacterium]